MTLTYLDTTGREVTHVFRCKQCKVPLTQLNIPCSTFPGKHHHGRCVACSGVIVCIRVPMTAQA
jgi:hypothetical protein